jgi:Lrp/AsnC family leucine-responsive transcriptional regulator
MLILMVGELDTVKSTVLMDQYGRKLLTALQRDARASVADLSRQIGLSQTRTAERLRRMEEAGIIQGYTVEIDPEALGLPMLAYIRLTCSGGKYNGFLSFVKSAPHVQECHHLTGGDAFLLKVAVASIAELERLVEKLLPYGDPITSIVLSSPVAKNQLPVPG